MYPESVRDGFVDAWSREAVRRWGVERVDARLAATDHLARIEAALTLEEFAQAEFDLLAGRRSEPAERWRTTTGEWMRRIAPGDVEERLSSIDAEMLRRGRAAAEFWVAVAASVGHYLEREDGSDDVDRATTLALALRRRPRLPIGLLSSEGSVVGLADALLESWLTVAVSPETALSHADAEALLGTPDSRYGMRLARAHGLV